MEQNRLAERSHQSFTRLARFINQLMREQLFCGPVTVQQCYTLEALLDGPKSMNTLAAEVALHQSTLTRIVEKLEKQHLVHRQRKETNKRKVEVHITENGRKTYLFLKKESLQMISGLLNMIPKERQASMVEAIEELANLLNPASEAFRALLKGCRCDITQGTGAE